MSIRGTGTRDPGRQVGAALLVLALAVLPARASAVVEATGANARCQGQPATITGTASDDVLRGTAGDDVIAGLGGDDVITGLDGSDTICGGPGGDRIDAGPGRTDAIFAGDGADRVEAGPGFQDIVYAGAGSDVVHGGRGRNLLIAGPGRDRMYGSSHYDTFESPGRRWDGDRDLFVGRGGRDSFAADPGNDIFKGGGGKDRVSYFDAPSGIRMDLQAGTSVGDGRDTLSSIEHVFGSRHDDVIRGTQRRNELSSSTGDDRVYGLGGNDDVFDDGGRDHLDGGGGDDRISSSGCSGSSDGPTQCQMDPPLPDRLIGGPGNDQIGSGPGEDEISGNGGNDWLFGGDGADSLFGGDGDDTLEGGTAAGTDPDADDGDRDDLDGGPGTDHCSPAGDNLTNCEQP